MRALVPAGGLGSRLRPLTQTGAKQLLPIGNKPIIHYVLEDIRDAGITDVVVLVGTETAAGITANLKDGSEWGLEIRYVHQDQPLGLAHCVITAEEQLRGDSFVMYLGDNMHKGELSPYADDFRSGSSNATILLSQVSEPREFGVAQFDQEGALQKLVEKPENPPSEWVMTGMYLFDETILKAVHAIKPSRRNELEITDAIQWLIDHGYDVQHRKLEGWWKDTGKPDDLLEANLLVLQDIRGEVDSSAIIDDASQLLGNVKVGAGVEIRRSVIRGPVIVGDGAVIEDSYIGSSTSLGARSKVIHSEVSCSIIMEGAVVENLPTPIDWSLIGRDAVVRRADNQPKAVNLIVGDVSRVALV
jgi:glucose-1-phosphate thymidylyltransferase